MKQSMLRSWTCGVTTCLVLALLAVPASADDGSYEEGWGKLLRYTGCAVSIIAAPTGWALVSAVVLCGVLLESETN